MKTYWGDVATDIAGIVEHEAREWDDDPFSVIHGVESTAAKPCESADQ